MNKTHCCKPSFSESCRLVEVSKELMTVSLASCQLNNFYLVSLTGILPLSGDTLNDVNREIT